jgi:hypothetical protein
MLIMWHKYVNLMVAESTWKRICITKLCQELSHREWDRDLRFLYFCSLTIIAFHLYLCNAHSKKQFPICTFKHNSGVLLYLHTYFTKQILWFIKHNTNSVKHILLKGKNYIIVINVMDTLLQTQTICTYDN